jgi:hypothetical protein
VFVTSTSNEQEHGTTGWLKTVWMIEWRTERKKRFL